MESERARDGITHVGTCLPPSADTYSGHVSLGYMRLSTLTSRLRDTHQVPG